MNRGNEGLFLASKWRQTDANGANERVGQHGNEHTLVSESGCSPSVLRSSERGVVGSNERWWGW